MVNGDPAIATAVAAAIKNTLQAADVSIIDERFIDGLSPGDSIASMRASALAGGGDVIVMADIIKTGERKLNYAGRTDTQTIANLQVSALLLQERKNLGASWNESLEYVPLNSADKARAAAEPIANELVKRLRELAAAQ
jgi:hypothetical protein